MTSRVQNLLEEVDTTILHLENISNHKTDKEKAYLAKYLVVYISGTYEECIKEIISSKVSQYHSPELSRFTDLYLYEKFRNPSHENIHDLLIKFNRQWAEDFKLIDPAIKEALDTIVTNKNDFAHGKISNITLGETIILHKKAVRAIKKICNITYYDELDYMDDGLFSIFSSLRL